MIDNIEQIINSKALPPILFMFGEEDFLLEEAYKSLIQAIIALKSSEFDSDIFDAEDITLDRLSDICTSFPLMSDKRVVVVKHFDALITGRASQKNDDKSPFARYLNNPQPTTSLIITASVDSLNGIKDAFKKSKTAAKYKKIIDSTKFPFNILVEKHEWIEFPKVYESGFSAWVIKRFKSLRKEITPEATELLITQTNPTLRDLSNEIEKLIIFVNDKKSITIEDVSLSTGNSRVFNVFEFQKAVGSSSVDTALKMLDSMLSAERQEMLIMTILSKFFITLWKLIDEAPKSTSQFDLSRSVGVNIYFLPEYLNSLKLYSTFEIEKAIQYLTETDEILKSTSTDSLLVMQQMLLKIMEKQVS